MLKISTINNKEKLSEKLNEIKKDLKGIIVSEDLQSIIFPIINDSWNLGKIRIENILLCKNNTSLERYYKWLGLKFREDTYLLPQNVDGNILYEFKETSKSSIVSLQQAMPSIRIIFIDTSIKNKFILETLKKLTLDTPYCFIIDNASNQKELFNIRLKLLSTCLNIDNIMFDELLPNGFIDLITSQKFQRKRRIINTYQELNSLLTASKVVEHSIQQKQKTYKSDDFINDKLILKNISKDKAISTKNSTDLKAELTKKFRSINTLIDERTQELEQENPDSFLTRIKEDISKMDNFSEEEQVRNVMYKIPKGALDRYSNQVQFKLKSSFDSTLFEIKRSLDEINEIVFSSFKELVKKQPLLLSKSLPSELTQEVLNQHIQYSRSYEKSITKKGIQNLLMEIRTPLFMLMPLMMFFGLFGAIFQENDEGEILNDKTTHNGKNAVVITKLPSKYTSPELFITKLYSGSIKTKFTKSEAGKSKLQLGQIEKKILLPYGTKSKIEYRPDYSKESGNLIVYLPADADRDFVINALLNPANGLLVIPGRAGGPGGYSAIPKFLNKLGNKRYLLVGGLFVLLIWFIIKKQREFKTEKMEIRDREKKNMKQNLRQDMERMVRGSTSKWKSRVSDYVNERQANLQLMIDDKLSKVIENNKEMVQESNSLLSRRKKNTEVQLKNLKSNTEKLKKTKKEIIFMKSNFRKIEGFIE